MVNRIFLEIGIKVTGKQREMLLPSLIEFGCDGFMETEDTLYCYIEKERWNDARFNQLKENYRFFIRNISSNIPITVREIIEENWNEKWERSVQPLEIGEKFVVVPSWSTYKNDHNRIVLNIDPKMSFGTGYHETTRLTMILLERFTRQGTKILDVGTGTGILAIAAVKLGASHALGIDIDPWSIDNANENVARNYAEDSVKISEGQPEEIINQTFDLIASNLTLNTNIHLLNVYRRILSKGGILILSGFLANDADEIKTSLINNGYIIKDIIYENEWSAVAAVITE